MEINELLEYTVVHKASDLHLSSGATPLVRIDGELTLIDGAKDILQEADIKSILYSIVPKRHIPDFEKGNDIDFSFGIQKVKARFRGNIFYQSRGISAAIRCLPLNPPTLVDLGLPDVFKMICHKQNGLVLVTGPTGSGKSTTLAAMIDYINGTKHSHILTIEDPIEYVYDCKKCLVQQREVGLHADSFNSALRSALRQDPEYILVGEMRDTETIRLALTAAETGHLVFATLHTNSAADAIDRIVDAFSTNEKSLIRAMIANSLRAVIAQRLLKKIGGGRIAANEIMICNTAIRNMIRENKITQIYSAIQIGGEAQMHTLAQHVQQFINDGVVDSAAYEALASGQ